MSKIAIYCEGNLGAGRHAYAAAMAKSLSDQGHDVLYASSTLQRGDLFDYGENTVFLELPGVEHDPLTKSFLTPNGLPLSQDMEYQKIKAKALAEGLQAFGVDALITESYPISRGEKDFELVPAIEQLTRQENPALIFSLTRQVPTVTGNSTFYSGGSPRTAAHMLNENFTAALLIGDDRFIDSQSVFPPEITEEAGRVMIPVGFFMEGIPERREYGEEEKRPVVLSSGGSYNACSGAIYKLGIPAVAEMFPDHPVEIFISKDVPEEELAEIRALADRYLGENATVQFNSPAFRTCLANAEMAIVQAGASTTTEVTKTGTPAVFLPYLTEHADITLQEQYINADAAQQMTAGRAHNAAPHPSTVEEMVTCLQEAQACSHHNQHDNGRSLNTNGIAVATEIVETALAMRQEGKSGQEIQESLRDNDAVQRAESLNGTEIDGNGNSVYGVATAMVAAQRRPATARNGRG